MEYINYPYLSISYEEYESYDDYLLKDNPQLIKETT